MHKVTEHYVEIRSTLPLFVENIRYNGDLWIRLRNVHALPTSLQNRLVFPNVTVKHSIKEQSSLMIMIVCVF